MGRQSCTRRAGMEVLKGDSIALLDSSYVTALEAMTILAVCGQDGIRSRQNEVGRLIVRVIECGDLIQLPAIAPFESLVDQEAQLVRRVVSGAPQAGPDRLPAPSRKRSTASRSRAKNKCASLLQSFRSRAAGAQRELATNMRLETGLVLPLENEGALP